MTHTLPVEGNRSTLIEWPRRDSRLLSIAWAKLLGVPRGTVQHRIDRLPDGFLVGFTVQQRTEGDAHTIKAQLRCSRPAPARAHRFKDHS
jgi:hypothetical protein